MVTVAKIITFFNGVTYKRNPKKVTSDMYIGESGAG